MKFPIFKSIVRTLGENIYINSKPYKASLKNSTSAVYSLANRAFYVEGQCETGPYEVGDSFIRCCDSKEYCIFTVVCEPVSPGVSYIYAAQYNAKVDIYRYKGKEPDKCGDLKDVFELLYEQIPVYRDLVPRTGKNTNDGLMDQSIYTIIIPHKYGVCEHDRIVMKYARDGEYQDTAYMVEAVGNALSDTGGTGIDSLQLSYDTRNEVEDNAEL